MALALRIDSGSRANRTFAIEPGITLRVGRQGDAAVSVPDDPFLSGFHLEVAFDGQTCTLTDLGSRNGTLLNGIKVTSASLSLGDRVTAGQTVFTLVEQQEQGAEPPTPESGALDEAAKASLLYQMRTNLQPLYAVLDAARDPRIPALLSGCRSQYLPLLDESASSVLRPFAPYLVALPAESTALELLVQLGWGQRWGVYLTSTANGPELHSVLRRLLIAYLPDRHQVFLRFYDPRVLRNLLEEPTEQQCAAFFSHVQSYVMEGERPRAALGMTRGARHLERVDILLAHRPIITRTPVVVSASPGMSDGGITLTTGQINRFIAQETSARTERLMLTVRRENPDERGSQDEGELRELVVYSCKHSQRYGIRSDRDVRGYTALMLRLGRNFDQDPCLSWASNLLSQRLSPSEKLARLKEMACRHRSLHESATP